MRFLGVVFAFWSVCVCCAFFPFLLGGQRCKGTHTKQGPRKVPLMEANIKRHCKTKKKITYNYTYIKYKINNENDFSFGNSTENRNTEPYIDR